MIFLPRSSTFGRPGIPYRHPIGMRNKGGFRLPGVYQEIFKMEKLRFVDACTDGHFRAMSPIHALGWRETP